MYTLVATQQCASLFMQHNSVHHYSCNTTACITIHATQQCASLFMQHDSVHHYSCNTTVCITIHATRLCASLFMQHESVHHYSCNTTVCITIHATQQCASLFMQHNSVHHYSCNQKLSAFFSLPSGSSVWSLWPVSMHLKMFGFSTAVLNGVIVLVQNRMPAVQGNLMLLFPNSFSNCGSI